MSLVGQIKEKYHNYKYIYTDGSMVEEKVAATAVTDSEIFMNRLADHSSIFTAEAKAISLALDHIKKTNNTRYIIFLDSLSCLQAFLKMQASPKNPWVVRVLQSATNKIKYNKIQSAEIQRKSYRFLLDSKSYRHKRQWRSWRGCKRSSVAERGLKDDSGFGFGK